MGLFLYSFKQDLVFNKAPLSCTMVYVKYVGFTFFQPRLTIIKWSFSFRDDRQPMHNQAFHD